MPADLPAFLNALADIPAITDPVLVRQRSRDMSGAFSPVLKREAKDRSADVLLRRGTGTTCCASPPPRRGRRSR